MSFQESSGSSNPSSGPYVPVHKYYRGLSLNLHNPNNLDFRKIQALEPPKAHDFPSGYLTCPNFFTSIQEQDFVSRATNFDWDYTERRNAQMILPFLYLGPLYSAQNENFIKKEGITMLFAIKDRNPPLSKIVDGRKYANALGIEADSAEVGDNQQLLASLPNIIRRINDHLCKCGLHEANKQKNEPRDTKRKVLVFCHTGNQISVSVVIGYLMAMLNLDAETALVNVQARRFSAVVDNPTKEAMETFESILNANRDVTKCQNSLPPHPLSSNGEQASRGPLKRQSFEDEDTVLDDGDINKDKDRFQNRVCSAPFEDSSAN